MRGWTSIVAITLAFALPATQAGAETLAEALSLTYLNNPEINAERAQVRAVDEGVPLAKAGRRPTIEAGADITASSTSTVRSGSSSSDDRVDGTVDLSASQTLFNGFRTTNAIREAEASVLGARETLDNVVQNRLFDAVQAYLDVLRDRALLELRRRNVTFLVQQLEAAQARFDVGENTRTDVAQTRARLALAESTVALAVASLRASEASYMQVVGRMPGALTDTGLVFRRLIPASLDAAIDIAQDRNPAITAAIHQVDAAAFDVKQIEGEILPTVALSGSVRHTFGIDNEDRTTSSQLTGRVRVPLYQGGAVAARVRQAKEILGLRRIQVDVLRDQVRALVQTAFGQYGASGETVLAATAAVEAANIALAGVQEEQSVGQRTVLDVLNAQQELLNARVNLVVAQRDRVVSAFQLLLATGALDPDILRLKVERYRPEEHYEAVKDKWYGLRTPDGR